LEAFDGPAAVSGGLIDPSAVAALAGRRDLKLQRVPGPVYAALLINQRRPTGDAAVRLAVAAAIDLPNVVEAARAVLEAEGLGPPAGLRNLGPYYLVGGPGVPGSASAAGQVDEPGRDLALAGRTLADAGWRDLDGDGLLQRGEHLLRLSLVLPQGRPDLAAAGAELARQLREIGISLTVREVSLASYLAAWAPPFDFDLLLVELNSTPDGDLYELLHSSQAPLRGPEGVLRGGANIAGVNDPALDAILTELAQVPLTDADGRGALYRSLSGRLAEQAPLVVLWREAIYYAQAPDLEGPAPGPFALYWNVYQWRRR
jgi:peptide/nickel transport system substrate-binding protein